MQRHRSDGQRDFILNDEFISIPSIHLHSHPQSVLHVLRKLFVFNRWRVLGSILYYTVGQTNACDRD